MKYIGNDTNDKKSIDFVDAYCEPIKNSIDDESGFEVCIYTKENKEKVASITGFWYNYLRKDCCYGKADSFHIKALWTSKKFERMGFATFLVKEAIRFAEEKRVKYISVNPCADRSRISQDALEKFYKNFFYHSFRLKREECIKFDRVDD